MSHPLDALTQGPHALTSPPLAAAAGGGGLTREQMEAQLLTLERYGEAAAAARAQGGPAAGLAALLRQPVKCGPYTLYPLTISVFLFLKAINSPLLTVGAGEVDMDDLARALLAFTGPEHAATFLRFSAQGITADMAMVHRAGWQIASSLSTADMTIAAGWLATQMAGAAEMMPSEDAEDTANFQSPPVETAAPEAQLPRQAPPAGSL